MKRNFIRKAGLVVLTCSFFIVANLTQAQGDDCATATVITPGTYTGTTVGANPDVVPFCGTADGAGGGVWYQITGSNNCGVFTASLCTGTTFDSKIRVYDGSCGSLNCVGGNDDQCGVQSEITWNYTAGTTYYILVHGSGAAEGTFSLEVTETSTDVIAPVPASTLTAGSVDQSDYNNQTYMAGFSQMDLAQSFTPTQNTICGASVFTQSTVGTMGNLTISLYTNLPNAGGVLLASGVANNVTPGMWAEAIWSPVSITPGNVYYLVFTCTDMGMGLSGDLSNTYPGGNVYANSGYGFFGSYDYNFETFYGCGVLPTINSTCPLHSLTIPTANDNCAGVISGALSVSFPISTNTLVTWTYDDGNGNISTENQQINVMADAVDPVPNMASLSDLMSQCSGNPTPPTATDNCAGTITATPDVTLPITTQGTTMITWTYDDGNGNSVTQTQNVILADVTAPVANIASLSDETLCSPATPVAPTATDNCAGIINGTPNVAFPITSAGLTVVTWTYDDGNGNTSSQTQNITVNAVNTSVTQTGATLSADATGATYVWLDCNNSYAAIPGETAQTFTPSAVVGNYAVEVTENGCVDTSICFLVDYTGISELNADITIAVYPNPSNNILNIQLDGLTNDVCVIRITDAQGRIVFTKSTSNMTSTHIEKVDVSLFENGVYVVEVLQNNALLVSKQVVKL